MENTTMGFHKDIGTLIAFEGISGCGKSESIRELSGYLSSIGYCVYITEWNSNKTIRNLVGHLHSKKLLTAFVYSILQWISFLKDYYFEILPLLKKDCVVIADRYIYTGITRDKANGTTGMIGRQIFKIIKTPDIIFFFDTSPETCKKRIRGRDKELFHTNKQIHKNRLLRDKELYYLKQMRIEYIKCFDNFKISENSNMIRIINNHCYINDYVRNYIEQKHFGVHESPTYQRVYGE